MPTTRHHLNNLRRRQAREALRPPAGTDAPGARGTSRTSVATDPVKDHGEPRDQPQPTRTQQPTRSTTTTLRKTAPAPKPSSDTDRPHKTTRTAAKAAPRPPAPRRTLVALCLLTLVLAGFTGWAHARAEALRDTPAARNTALSDTARTSEIKGQSTKAVAALFSYDHADPRALDKAAKEWLTGRAVAQHRDLLGDLRTRADKQKAVITTTVTDSAVERIDGDRARVLVYADQSSVSTAGDKKAGDDGTYAGAMFAVDVERHDGRWRVSRIDTFSR
ncbi:hypothetical protein ACFVYR_37670 [Streptomyces sp. NPDC058284]|uniref:hypothetical protein n=1 Tax=unclassified Streptomyces TaxID=2593676 RepID=UPI00365460BC